MHSKNRKLLGRSIALDFVLGFALICLFGSGCSSFQWGSAGYQPGQKSNVEEASVSDSNDEAEVAEEDASEEHDILEEDRPRASLSRTPVPRKQVLKTREEPPLLSWPVPMSTRLTQKFKPTSFRKHLGLDLADRAGTTITAAHDGWVTYAGSAFNGYGKLIIIETSDGWGTIYGHCKKILVKEGQRIKRGQRIARMGRSGNAHGVHLHFELMKESQPIDPLLFLGARRAPYADTKPVTRRRS